MDGKVQSITTIFIISYGVESIAKNYYNLKLHVSALSVIIRL
jgi:hypothetical protein